MAHQIRENVPLAPYTTLRLGGSARYLSECRSTQDLREALVFARQRDLPVQVLGGGSNVIVRDAGYPGLVVKIARGGVAFDEDGDGVDVRVGAGVVWDELVAAAVGRGLAGIECLSGIPGSAGAAPVQNVGAYGQEIRETLVGVRCMDREALRVIDMSNEECGFAYRQSRFKGRDRDRYVILDVRLRLRRDSRPHIRYGELERAVQEHVQLELDTLEPTDAVAAVRETVIAVRRRKSMVVDASDPNSRSVGSFFLNPVLTSEAYEAFLARPHVAALDGRVPAFPAANGVKVSAAWLVEQAGFDKGHRHGGVGISTRHALALVNSGGTAAELLELADSIEATVLERFGIRLEREPVVVG